MSLLWAISCVISSPVPPRLTLRARSSYSLPSALLWPHGAPCPSPGGPGPLCLRHFPPAAPYSACGVPCWVLMTGRPMSFRAGSGVTFPVRPALTTLPKISTPQPQTSHPLPFLFPPLTASWCTVRLESVSCSRPSSSSHFCKLLRSVGFVCSVRCDAPSSACGFWLGDCFCFSSEVLRSNEAASAIIPLSSRGPGAPWGPSVGLNAPVTLDLLRVGPR